MHMRGVPATMQQCTHYTDLLKEIKAELRESIAIARNAGISREHIAIDPGIGFSKNAQQNVEIIRNVRKTANIEISYSCWTITQSIYWHCT